MKSRVKLLIVDDEKASRDVLVGLLANEERAITTARNGLEAKELLDRDSFDMILTDLNMPGMDGMELLRDVQRKENPPLVIMITGYASLENTLKAIEEGAYDYITKPFKLAEMEVLVRNACEKILLTREKEALAQKIRENREEIKDLTKRVTTLTNRIRQVKEREETLFLGNFDLKLPLARKALPVVYAQGERKQSYRERVITQLKKMLESGEMSEDEARKYWARFNRTGSPQDPS
ncbi:MAG: response regulator [Deltaproteobacteria bacterium]|nr:response regulator [Deltaproteobacteria bacterium]